MEQTYPEQCQRPFGPDDSCDCNPEFSVICSFISLFGDKIDIELNIEWLKDCLENQETLDENFIDLHVKLLKKLRRYFVRDQWEKALMRFAFEYSYEDGRAIEFLGYLKTPPSLKLNLLRRLLDAQFECDQKFKAAVNLHEANELRNQPVGRDIKGNTYWHCADSQGSFRIFSEEPLNYKTWKLVSKTPDELKDFIDELDNIKDDKVKGEPHKEPYNPFPEIFSDYFVKLSSPKENEEEVDKRTSNKATKKGRHRGRSNKSSPLTVLQEVDESDSKVETKLINHQAICNSNQTPNNHDQSRFFYENGSVESQVKQTLDNLITKVVTSFDFFFRWNSNDSNDSSTKKDVKDEALTNGKKRSTKRAKVNPVELPRRSSSRIQQLQQKKITEYLETSKKIPEIQKCESHAKRSDAKIESKPPNVNHTKSSKRPKKNGQRWRSKGRKKLSWDKDDSDLSSPSSLTDSNDESFVEELHNALNSEPTNDDDEFACEEEETNDAPVIVKRARTARQTIDTEENGDLINGSMLEEDKPCGRCDKSNDPELILLCDMCDDGYHTTCCTPPLMFVPDGDWFCSPCEHKMLTTKLREILASLNELVSAKEREQQKKQKLRQKSVKKVKPVVEYEDEVLMDTESELDVPDSDESFHAPSKSDSEEDEDEDEGEDEYDVTEVETETDSSLDEIVAFELSRPKRKRNIKKIEYESELDISDSDESFHASSESEDGEEDVTEIETQSDSSIDEIAFNFSRSKRKRSRIEYDESDESDY